MLSLLLCCCLVYLCHHSLLPQEIWCLRFKLQQRGGEKNVYQHINARRMEAVFFHGHCHSPFRLQDVAINAWHIALWCFQEAAGRFISIDINTEQWQYKEKWLSIDTWCTTGQCSVMSEWIALTPLARQREAEEAEVCQSIRTKKNVLYWVTGRI